MDGCDEAMVHACNEQYPDSCFRCVAEGDIISSVGRRGVGPIYWKEASGVLSGEAKFVTRFDGGTEE